MLVDFSSCSVKLQCPLYVHKCIMEESLQLVILSFTIEIKTSDTCRVFVSCFWISFCVAIPHRIGYDKLIHVQHSAIFKFIYNTVTGVVNFLLCLENMNFKEMCQNYNYVLLYQSEWGLIHICHCSDKIIYSIHLANTISS